MKPTQIAFFSDESGSVAAVSAIVLVVLLGMAAMALDIAHLVSVRRDLTKAAEAGALAGARGLWPKILPSTSASRSPDTVTAWQWAYDTARDNPVDGIKLAVNGVVSVSIGRWDYTTSQFTAGSAPYNAVKVTTRRDGVKMILGHLFGVFSRDVRASAIAVMDFAKAVGQGSLPIAINQEYTDPGTVLFINFTPDPLDNGGWFTETSDSANAATFKDYIENASCPPLKVGDIINLQNGNDTTTLQLMKDTLALHTNGWYVMLPVVNTSSFNHAEPIMAFVPFKITEINDTSNPKGVTGTVVSLAEVPTALPGGTNYGALAPPKIVH
jgi:Flp pilus assembly protein TadG